MGATTILHRRITTMWTAANREVSHHRFEFTKVTFTSMSGIAAEDASGH